MTAPPRRSVLPPMPERTPDGRYIVVDGRRWRATDPSLPEEGRQGYFTFVVTPS